MSILDKQLVLDDAQAITATANSANVYDMGVARDPFRGEGDLRLVASVDVAFTAAGAATLSWALVGADDAALTSNVVNIITGGPIAKATLAAGAVVIDAVIPNIPGNIGKRYVGIVWTVATGPFTAGKLTSRIQGLLGAPAGGPIYPFASQTAY